MYAVFEDERTGRQFIYYRANADRMADSVGDFYLPDEIPWADIESEAMRSMLRRFIDESRDMRYGVYFGNQRTGTVVHHDGD